MAGLAQGDLDFDNTNIMNMSAQRASQIDRNHTASEAPPEELLKEIQGFDPRIRSREDAAAVNSLDLATAAVGRGNFQRARALLEGTIQGALSDFAGAERSLERAAMLLKRTHQLDGLQLAENNIHALRESREELTQNLRPADWCHRQCRSVSEPREMCLRVFQEEQTFALTEDTAAKIEDVFYAHRVSDNNLANLRLFEGTKDNWNAAIPHLFHFVLPMAMGECYLELGLHAQAEQWFIRASRYRYINRTTEVPLVWEMLAETYVQWGHALVRQGDKTAARQRYSRVAVLGADPVDAASELYRSPTFDVFAQEARGLLQNTGTARPAVALRVRLARLNLVRSIPAWTFRC